MRPWRRLVPILALVVLMAASVRAEPGKHRYVVGVAPQYDSRTLFRIWRPVLAALEARTGHALILRGTPTIADFEKEISAGSFDFAFMNPYHMLVAHKRQKYIPLVRDVEGDLHGILVAPRDGPISDPWQLAGKTVAFPAPNAFGASLLMRAELAEDFGLSVVPKFVKTHSSVYLNVLLGEADAGGGVERTLAQQPAKVREALKVIHTTRTFPPHPFAAHPRVPAAVRERVRNAFLDLGGSEEGRRRLVNISIHKIGAASLDDYMFLEALGCERYLMGEK